MRNKKRKLLTAFVCMTVIGLTACGSMEGGSPDLASLQAEPITMEAGGTNDVQVQKDMEAKESEDGSAAEEELEKKLAAYREAREKEKPVLLGNGVTMGGSVSEEEYGISYDASILETFDSREIAEAYAAANSYVEDTLGITVETRNTTYHCVDPRIWAIYEAEDKGVANGYEPENIYVCEYCDNGAWNYLILVREGKGSAWEVIHHGSSYME